MHPTGRSPVALRELAPWRRRRSTSCSGFTLIELIIVMIILLVALLSFSRTLASLNSLRAVNRENAIASEAARSMLETMRNENLREVFALYNSDPNDDPDGAATAPGHRFAVQGLDPAPDAPDSLIGEITFPAIDVGPPGGPVDLELREGTPNAVFGMPRDLSGDSIIDDVDHTDDYYILPAQIRMRWSGKSGVREYRTFATFCDFNWR